MTEEHKEKITTISDIIGQDNLGHLLDDLVKLKPELEGLLVLTLEKGGVLSWRAALIEKEKAIAMLERIKLDILNDLWEDDGETEELGYEKPPEDLEDG